MVPGALAWSNQPVEVYIKGVRYESIEAYRFSKTKAKSIQGPASMEDDQLLRAKTRELGLAYNARNVKTIALKPITSISPQTAQQWQTLGYEHGVGRVIIDFKQNWDNPVPKFTVSFDELEGRLRALAADRPEPVLLISNSNKLRVMALDRK